MNSVSCSQLCRSLANNFVIRISAVLHSGYTFPPRLFGRRGLNVVSPPPELLVNNVARVGKYVRNLHFKAASSDPYSREIDPVPTFSKLTAVKNLSAFVQNHPDEAKWHEILRTTRSWPIERLQIIIIDKSTPSLPYDLLYNGQIVDIPGAPAVSQWKLTHLSFGGDYSTDLPFFSWLLGCDSSVLNRLTHIRIIFGPDTHRMPFDVSWDDLFSKLPLIKMFVLQFAYPPSESRRSQMEALPDKERRLMCFSLPERVVMSSLIWDGRDARERWGKSADYWDALELMRDTKLAHVEQYFEGINLGNAQ